MDNRFNKIKNSFIPKKNRGLTLVELLVVVAIFMIITSIAIFNYGDFSSNVSLQNLTDDIALSIRKAQSFAIGARGTESDTDGIIFTKKYGVHFSTNEEISNSPLSGSNKSFLLFATDVGNNEYTIPETGTECGDILNECMELFKIKSIDSVSEINAYDGDGNFLQGNSTSSTDIIFTRPDPRASFCFKEYSASSECSSNISRVEIVISNNQDNSKRKDKIISVQNTGQISIQQK